MIAAIVEGAASHAFCMAMARLETSLRPSSKESAPAATNAENSPNEWPATMSGANSSPSDLANMTECRNMAGWVTLVCLSSSSVPPNIMSVMEKPRMSFALSKRALASGIVS